MSTTGPAIARTSSRRLETADVVVIGAGVSGLSFANWWRAARPGERVVVVEAEPEPGGYCRTIARDGFTWDFSGHFFHFRDPSIEAWLRARMPGADIRTVARVAKIRYAGRDIDYPFQTHIHQLPLPDFLECLVELYFRPSGDAPPASFKDMLYRRLGKGITDKFLRPYNEKLYATDLDRLDVDAMGRFFPHVELADVIAAMRPGVPGSTAGYNATFTYPTGGAVEYVRALLRDLPGDTVACGERAIRIDLTARTVDTTRRRIACRRIVSSAPLPVLAMMCGVPFDTRAFSANQVLVWNLGFDRKGAEGVHWMYFPDRDTCFYRVGWYDNIHGSDRMSLYVEVGAADGAKHDRDTMLARVLADLAREKIVDGHQLVAHHHVVLDPAYVHITRASLAETTRLRAQLAAHEVHSVGRYGGWTYCSIEDNMIETRELAKRLAGAHVGST